ncbi:MAG TPA: GerMN domain-containing protein [Lachnospiraceae bacterium]|nr:GerMN domain-containing protein [Lachnospiraceae bacterium]
MKNRLHYLVLFLVVLALSGCGKATVKQEDTTEYQIYFINKNETKVTIENYDIAMGENVKVIEDIVKILQTVPEKTDLKAPLSGNASLISCNVDGEQLYLNFDEHYKELSSTTEVLIRAALVRTFTQLPGVKYVNFLVKGVPLTDTNGNPVGIMTAEQFIDNAGNEISTYEKASLRLFFADESGEGLIEVVRQVVFNSNISMEKLVLEQLILGPNNEESSPTINPETKVISVTVKDGVCYVNLDESFLTQIYDVTSDITLYSITNSLVELSNINKVQISINGETDILYREKISLDTVFERNLDIVISGVH